MHTTHLRKIGGSAMFPVPPALLALLRLRPGARVAMAVERGRLVIEPLARPHYSLDELLAQGRAGGRRRPVERDWTASGAVGREVI
jgi:antitoxin ChpS